MCSLNVSFERVFFFIFVQKTQVVSAWKLKTIGFGILGGGITCSYKRKKFWIAWLVPALVWSN